PRLTLVAGGGARRALRPSFRGDAQHRTRNLEIPGLVRSLSSGRALRGPVGTIPECRAESVSWIKPPSGSLRDPGIQLALAVALGHFGRGQHASDLARLPRGIELLQPLLA